MSEVWHDVPDDVPPYDQGDSELLKLYSPLGLEARIIGALHKPVVVEWSTVLRECLCGRDWTSRGCRSTEAQKQAQVKAIIDIL